MGPEWDAMANAWAENEAEPAREYEAYVGKAARRADKKRRERMREPYESGTDGTRSMTPPGLHPTFNIHDVRVPESSGPQPAARVGRGRWSRDKRERAGPQRIILKTRADQRAGSSSPAPAGAGQALSQGDGSTQRRPRPLTAHQIAVERNRQQRVDYLLDRRLRKIFHACKSARRKDGVIWRAWVRHEATLDPLANSDDDRRSDNHSFRDHGPAGLVALTSEADDFGEEIAAYAAAIRRTARRLDRWDALGNGVGGVMGTTRKLARTGRDQASPSSSKNDEDDENDFEDDRRALSRRRRGSSPGPDLYGDGDEEGDAELDDMDRELLGELDAEGEEGEGDEEEEMMEDDEMDVD